MDFAGAGRQEDVGRLFQPLSSQSTSPANYTAGNSRAPVFSVVVRLVSPRIRSFPSTFKTSLGTDREGRSSQSASKQTKKNPWAEALANLSTALSQLFLTKGYRFGTLPLSSCFSQGCSSSLRARDDDIGGAGWWLWALNNFQELLGQEMPRHMPVLADCRDPARILAQCKVWKMYGYFKALPKLASWMFLSITVWAWAKEQCPEMLWGMVWEIGGSIPTRQVVCFQCLWEALGKWALEIQFWCHWDGLRGREWSQAHLIHWCGYNHSEYTFGWVLPLLSVFSCC